MRHDPVNHPVHYTSHPSGIECIEITRHMNFNCGNAVKYVWRHGLKPVDVNDGPGIEDAIQDLSKAIWYLRDEIERLTAMFGSDEPSGPDEPVGYEFVDAVDIVPSNYGLGPDAPPRVSFDDGEAVLYATGSGTYTHLTPEDYQRMRDEAMLQAKI